MVGTGTMTIAEIAELSKIISAFVIAVGVAQLIITHRNNRRLFRVDRKKATISAAERIYSEIANKTGPPSQEMDISKRRFGNLKEEERNTLVASLEFFSIAVNDGVYDLKIVERSIGGLLSYWFEVFRQFIAEERKKRGKRVYNEFEYLVRKVDPLTIDPKTDPV